MEHGEFLRSVTANLQEVLDLRRWREANFDPADRALLNFAEAFTLESHEIQARDIEGLRRVGFSDPDILAMTLCAGYRHYITRIADATGIEIDSQLEIPPVLVEAYTHSRRDAELPGKASTRRAPRSRQGPWVEMNDKPEQDPTLGPIWNYWTLERGHVPGLLKALSLIPEPVQKLDSFWRLARAGVAKLGCELEASIGLTIGKLIPSPWLSSFYENTSAGREGRRSGLRENQQGRGQILLAFVAKITERASAVAQQDVEKVRKAGLPDPEILDLIVATALLNCMGRMANALGVPNDEP